MGDPPLGRQGNASSKMPPRPSGGIVIWEPTGGSQHVVHGVPGQASSSRQPATWQPTFMLGSEPLPATASLRLWAQGEGGRVAHSLASGLMLLEDVHFFRDGTEDSIAKRLQWHTVAVNILTYVFLYFSRLVIFCFNSYRVYRVYVIGRTDYLYAQRKMTELTEDAEREKALKDVAADTAREKTAAAESAERRAQSEERARQQAEKKAAELEAKPSEIELRLAKAESLSMAHTEEVADLKATLEACEEKWYNEGFADAENSVEPVVMQARAHGFDKGWMAALRAAGVPGDSPLLNPENIPRPIPSNPVQSQADAADEEDTPSMRELVRAIDTHVEDRDMEVTSNLNSLGHEETHQQPGQEGPDQASADFAPLFQTNPAI
ncbi:hypothetical protein SO802_025353 [Lithocarpus litseifolius]|uniref:Uncharacterized protein n=1 Tax=Lithocarpus litseifolius TaxID=425828 RepID=A0AAW2BXH6_9ROSI